jgi:hypothetical protein
MSLIGQPKRSLITIEVDDDLMAAALRRPIRRHRQMQAFTEIAGPGWDGDLDEMRNDLL